METSKFFDPPNGSPVQRPHISITHYMASHGLTEPVIGIAFDGSSYGIDGQVWGGDFLVCDYAGFHRAAHLQLVPLPFWEKGKQEPWEMAYSHLLNADLSPTELSVPISKNELQLFEKKFFQGQKPVFTSSMGKLFDAVSAMLSLCSISSYEGEARVELERLASTADESGPGDYEFLIFEKEETWVIDPGLLLARIQRDLKKNVSRSSIAIRFHHAVSEMVVRVCKKLREQNGLNQIVLSGAVFSNSLLDRITRSELDEEGFQVHSRAPVRKEYEAFP